MIDPNNLQAEPEQLNKVLPAGGPIAPMLRATPMHTNQCQRCGATHEALCNGAVCEVDDCPAKGGTP